jgi:cytochrome c oxidase subunit 2
MLVPPRIARVILLALSFCMSQETLAAYTVNMTRGVTSISKGIHSLHMTIFWICVVVGIIVFAVMFYAIIYHRKSKGAVAAHFHESTLVEILWALVPFAILIGMAIPATKMLLLMDDTQTDSEISIKITGYQWRWEYEYLGEGVRFISNTSTPQDQIQSRDVKGEHYLLEVDNPLIVPIGKKIRFLTTANDVIHSWWVPALGVKKDAIPGFINEAWATIEEAGTYRGQCAELCGANHGFMPIVIEAKTVEEYETWLASKKAANQPKPDPAATTTPSQTPSDPHPNLDTSLHSQDTPERNNQ